MTVNTAECKNCKNFETIWGKKSAPMVMCKIDKKSRLYGKVINCDFVEYEKKK